MVDRHVSEHADTHSHSLSDRVMEEIKRLLVIFIYLWAMFVLFELYEMVILRQRGIAFLPKGGFAIINAIALAKVMLVAEDLNFVHWVRRGPLIYPILIDSTIMTVLFICFNVLEHIVVGYFKHKTVAESLPTLGGGGLVGLACVALIMFCAILPFIACRYINRELGPGRLRAMLLGTKVPNPG